MMNHFPPNPMVYRLALVLGLLILPMASAEAAYQQDYRLPSAVEVDEQTQQTKEADVSNEEDVRPVMDEQGISVWDTDGDATMTRSVFIANLVRGMYTQGQIDSCFWSIAPSHPPRFELVFTDVPVDHPYAKEICIAMRDGIVRGYLDGSFGPDRVLTFAESAKILSRSYVLAPYAHTDVRSPWYAGHARALIVRNAVPPSIVKLSQPITATEAHEMIDRLENGITWRAAQSEEVLFPPVIVRRPAVVPSASTGSSTSSAASGAAASIRSSVPTGAASTSSVSPQMPASSRRSFWDLF